MEDDVAETIAALAFEVGTGIKSVSDKLRKRGVYVYEASGGFSAFWAELAAIGKRLGEETRDVEWNGEWPDFVLDASDFILTKLEQTGRLPDYLDVKKAALQQFE